MGTKVTRRCCAFLLGLSAGLALAACGDGDSVRIDTGTVKVAITDEAASTYDAVVIAIREVRAVPAGEEGATESGLPLVAAFSPPRVIDVLDLAYQQQLLGEAVLPAGNYSQIRLVLAENAGGSPPANYLTLANDPETRIPLKTPSGQTSGLKVLGAFAVGADEITTIVLDFDPNKAIVQAGQSDNWIFKPTGIRVVQVEDLLPSYGTIFGSVSVFSAVVQAVVPASGIEVASGAVNPEDGTFRLFLPPGDYQLHVTAAGYLTYNSMPPGFTVTTAMDTAAGHIALTPQAP